MRWPLPTPRAGAALRLLFLAAVVAVATAIGGPSEARTVHALRDSATGAVSLSDSRGGGAILSASQLHPGHSVSGSLTLTNSGDLPAAVSLSQADLVDSPGMNGARLSSSLVVEVDDVTSGRRVYFGPLAVMPAIPLGTFPAGGAREFRFTATLPGTAPGDLMGTSARVRYDWTATADQSGAGGGGGSGNGSGSGGGGGGGTTDPRPVPPTLLALTLKGKSPQKARTVSAFATCNSACTLTAGATLMGVKKKVARLKARIARTSANRAQPVKITVPIPKKTQKALKKVLRGKRSKARVAIVVTATGAGDEKVVRSLFVKLKR